jgi:hypothetical protein
MKLLWELLDAIKEEAERLQRERAVLAARAAHEADHQAGQQKNRAQRARAEKRCEAKRRRVAPGTPGRSGASPKQQTSNHARQGGQSSKAELPQTAKRNRGKTNLDPIQRQQVLREALQRHDAEVERLRSEAKKQREELAPVVVTGLKSLRLELQDAMLSGLATARVRELIERVNHRRRLLVEDEKARWANNRRRPRDWESSTQQTNPSDATSDADALQSFGGHNNRSHEVYPSKRVRTWAYQQDPGLGGHRDLTRD